MKLYIYEHCPYCVRVLTYLGVNNRNVEIITLDNDDIDTPISMVGQKLLPILEYSPGQYMVESLDIINFLERSAPQKLFEAQNSEIIEWISVTLPLIYRLTIPRWVNLPFAEFKTHTARNYFIQQKTDSIGLFKQAIELTDYYSANFLDKLRLINPMLGEQFIHGEFSKDDILLFSTLRGITCVKGLKLPTNTQKYLEFMAEKSAVNLLYRQAI